MKKLYQYPDCGAIFLKDIEKNVLYWQELNCFEKTALEVMLESPPLQAITGLIKVIKTSFCTSCHYLRNPYQNPN